MGYCARVTTIPLFERWDGLITDFLRRSKYYEMDKLRFWQQILDAYTTGAVWRIVSGHQNVGFFFMVSQPAEYGGVVGVVQAFYIDPKYRINNIMPQVDDCLQEFAASSGYDEVAFYTRRHPGAFLRAIGGDWDLDSYVIKRKV